MLRHFVETAGDNRMGIDWENLEKRKNLYIKILEKRIIFALFFLEKRIFAA